MGAVVGSVVGTGSVGAVVGAVVGAGSVAGGYVSGGRVTGGSVRSGSLGAVVGAVVGLEVTVGNVGAFVSVGLVVGPEAVDAGVDVESVGCVGMFT